MIQKNKLSKIICLFTLAAINFASDLSSSTTSAQKSFAYNYGKTLVTHKKKIGFLCCLPILVPAVLGVALAQKKRSVTIGMDWKSYENENQTFRSSINQNNTKLHMT